MSDKAEIQKQIKEQGEVVRRLKLDHAEKERVFIKLIVFICREGDMNVGHFGLGRFGPDISATENIKGGRRWGICPRKTSTHPRRRRRAARRGPQSGEMSRSTAPAA